MQLTYAPKAWAAERASWCAVIQLNLIRSVNTIVDALAMELTGNPPKSTSPTPYSLSSGSPSPSSDVGYSSASTSNTFVIAQEQKPALLKLKFRLAPLRQVEVDLKLRLGAGTDEITEESLLSQRSSRDADAMMATPFDESPYPLPTRRRSARDLIVRSHNSWKEKEKSWKLGSRSSKTSANNSIDADRDSATEVLIGCAEDVVALWRDPIVREMVRKRQVMGGLGDSAE